MLNGLPASAWISAVSRAISVSISPESRFSSLGSMRMPVLHARQHAGQRQLDSRTACASPRGSTAGAQRFVQFERVVGVLLGRGAQLQIEAALRQLFERQRRRVGVQQEGVEHHVVREPACLDAELRERQQQGLHVAGDLGQRGIFEQRPQVAR